MSDSAASEDDAIPTEKPDRSGLKTVPSLVVVNTGHGKGKSTAAFGTMLRAVALDWPVAVVQFLKSGDSRGSPAISTRARPWPAPPGTSPRKRFRAANTAS